MTHLFVRGKYANQRADKEVALLVFFKLFQYLIALACRCTNCFATSPGLPPQGLLCVLDRYSFVHNVFSGYISALLFIILD